MIVFVDIDLGKVISAYKLNWEDEDIASGSTTNNDNNEDREIIIAEIENLLANLEGCDKITISAEAKELIADQANIMDPCQPDKTVQELIEELITLFV